MDQPLFAPDQGFTIGPFLWLICYCLMVDSMRANIPKYKVIPRDKSSRQSQQLAHPLCMTLDWVLQTQYNPHSQT
jgi:hypothetical protein